MLNIYNTQLLKKYNILKKQSIDYINLKDKLNEQIKKSILIKSVYLNDIFTKPQNISKKELLTKIFPQYNKNFIENHIKIICKQKKELDDFNKTVLSKKIFKPQITNSYTTLKALINNIVEKYIHDFNIHKFITLRANEDFSTKTYIDYYVKKFLISFLIMEFNEASISITKEKITFTDNATKSPEKQLETKLNKLPLLPFCIQYISNNYALNYDRKSLFGHISKDVLKAFFSATTDSNPYNYTYLSLPKTSTDKRSSYTYDKYLDFLANFKTLFNNKPIETNFYDILQQDLLELITNANFIIYNSTTTPMNRAITAFIEKKEVECIKLRDYCCKFYYFCSLVPMPEYRLILSDLFIQSIFFERKLNTLDYKIEMNYTNSNINYETDTTVNCFNAYIEYLVEQTIPQMLFQVYNEINNFYQITTKDMSININKLNHLNQELMFLWDDIVKEFNKVQRPYYIGKTPYGKVYDCFLSDPQKQLFCLENNQLFANLANEHYKFYCEEPLSLSDKNKNAFINLHKLIFSAVYHEPNSFINNHHIAPQIKIKRLFERDETVINFDKWCYKNDNYIKEKFHLN